MQHYQRTSERRRGFTLIELLVSVTIIMVLVGITVPALAKAKQKAIQVQCAGNLHQLMLGEILYAQMDPRGMFPRAPFNPKQHLQLDDAGYMVPDTFGKSGYVGDNNVPASLFLLMKTQHLPSKLFVCPATPAIPGFVHVDPALSSNWERIPQNMTYSLAAPFPSVAALSFISWRNDLPPGFAVLADMNPGTRGNGAVPNNVTGPAHTASATALMAANSNNHANRGQNVAYGDAHVSFETTPYCGATHRTTGIPDNIYTAGASDFGICDDSGLPVDGQDSVMMPTDDPLTP